jgi:leader peptidase (prepilin peptidase)/N-methyltransferase
MDEAEPPVPSLVAVTTDAAARPDDVAGPGPDPAAPVPRAWTYGRHPRFTFVVWVAIAAVAVGVAWPAAVAVGTWLRPPRRVLADDQDLFNAIRLGLVEVGWAVWVFSIGAMVGSFLNVVVHRLPMGRSVIFGRSACPACGTGIRPQDNVPILAWLRLGGRCWHCGSLIDARYPLVEASLAGFCLALCYAELLSGGVTLPIRDPNYFAGLLWIVLYAKWDLIGIFVYHVAAVALALTWALIAADGRRIPARHVAAALVVMGLLPVALPWLHPVPLVHPPLAGAVAGAPLAFDTPEWLWRGLAVSLAGMAVGATVGAGLAILRRADHDRRPEDSEPAPGPAAPSLAAILALVGAVFGWQAVPAVALVALVAVAVARGWSRWIGRRGSIPLELCVVGAVVVHLFLWRWIVAAWSAAFAAAGA